MPLAIAGTGYGVIGIRLVKAQPAAELGHSRPSGNAVRELPAVQRLQLLRRGSLSHAPIIGSCLAWPRTEVAHENCGAVSPRVRAISAGPAFRNVQ